LTPPLGMGHRNAMNNALRTTSTRTTTTATGGPCGEA